MRTASEHVEREPRLVRHPALVPGRLEGELDRDLADARHRGHRVLHPDRHLAGHRAAGRRQRHLDGDVAVVVDVDLVDQSQLVDVGRDLGVVDGLERGDDVGRQLLQLLGRDRRAGTGGLTGAARLRQSAVLLSIASSARRVMPAKAGTHATLAPISALAWIPAFAAMTPHAKNSRALISASASASTSALVLYIANDARHVAVTPSRSISGWAQWWPARTATPERSMMVEMSCGCRPSMLNETIAPLSWRCP